MADGRTKITFEADPKPAVDASKKVEKSLKDTKSVGESFQQSTGKILGVAGAVGAVVAALSKAYDGIKNFSNAAGKLNSELKEIGDAQRINTTEGLTGQQQAIINANKIAEQQKEALKAQIEGRNLIEDAVAASTGYAEDQLKIQQIETSRLSALAQIEAHEKNIADFKKQQLNTYDAIMARVRSNLSQQDRNNELRAELAGGEAKQKFDDEMKLQTILKKIKEDMNEYQKDLIREEYALRQRLNEKEATDRAKVIADVLKKEKEDKEKVIKELHEKEMENQAKLQEQRMKDLAELLVSDRNQLGDIVSFGRGAAYIVNGGER